MVIHLFHYAQGEEKMASHDVLQKKFTTIAKDVGFHVLQKQTHVLSPTVL
jgi:hypothetical protein